MKKLFENIPDLLQWYRRNARDLPWRKGASPYHIWISEIMLQQTRVEAVIGHYARFAEALPDVRALAAVSDDTLHKLWEGLGYYSRARNLKKAAQIILREHGGELPRDYGQLLELPGIGRYTAGAIASIAFGLPYPAVDGNVLRVLSRFLGRSDDISRLQTKSDMERLLADAVPADSPGSFTQALMELGATVCLPNGMPNCADCPWRNDCTANLRHLQTSLPVKKAKARRRVEQRTILVIVRDGALALQKRGDTGLLAGMWELPALEGWRAPAEARAFLQDADCGALAVSPLPGQKHIFTHIEWHMTGYLVHADAAGRFTWASCDEVQSRYAIPSAFRGFIRAYTSFVR